MFLASIREVAYVVRMRKHTIQDITVLSQGIKAPGESVGPYLDMASHCVTRTHHLCKLSFLCEFSLYLKIDFTHLALEMTLLVSDYLVINNNDDDTSSISHFTKHIQCCHLIVHFQQDNHLLQWCYSPGC